MTTFTSARPVRFIILLGMLVSMLMPFALQSAFAQSTDSKIVVYPGVVSIQPGVCTDGVITSATVSVPSDTADDGIFYTITQPDATGNLEVHAQVGDAYTMGDTSGTGWERANEWNAYYRSTAPVPDCGDGPSLPDNTQADNTDDDADPAMGVFVLPQDCGSAPYPPPTGQNVTNRIVFWDFTITQNGEVHAGGPISLTSPTEELTLSFSWASTGPVSAGDFFEFLGPLDTNGQKVFTSATQYFPVMNTIGDAEAGCASVEYGDISVQFTEYVNPLGSVDGRISIDLVMAASSLEEATTIDFSFGDDSTFAIEIPGTPSGSFGKRGWFMRADQGLVENLGAVRWELHVPASPVGYTNLVLIDTAPADGSWTFSCAGPSSTETVAVASGPQGPVSIEFEESCDATSMLLTVASVPANTTIDFYFYADITPGAEGPFYNAATAQADEFERIDLPYEVQRTVGRGVLDGDFAVVPIPPAIDHAVCVDDVWVPASVTVPTGQEGVTYTMTPEPFPAEGGYLTVTATLASGYSWAIGADSNGWVLDNETNTMVYEANVLNNPCDVTPPPTPEEPCIPSPPEECILTPPAEGGTPEPCEPGPTPTIPAWCLETPTPPTVTELPETGTRGNGVMGDGIIAASVVTALVIAAAGITIQRERGQ